MAIPNTSVKRFIEDVDTRVSVGLDLPLGRQPGTPDGYFTSTKTTIDAVKNDIKLLLMTQKGERLMQPNLGLNLRRHLFEQYTEELRQTIQDEVMNTISSWLPFVQVVKLDVAAGGQDEFGKNTIRIRIDFSLNKDPRNLESVSIDIE